MKKVLKIVSHATLTLLFVLYIAYQFRTDPIGVLAGKQLTGDEVAYPVDWRFTNDHYTVAVETRPDNPHSVTTICFLLDGELFIPASDGSSKDWPSYVVNDPRARIKVGDDIYPVRLNRVTDITIEQARDALVDKYPRFADALPGDTADVWLFRVSSRG